MKLLLICLVFYVSQQVRAEIPDEHVATRKKCASEVGLSLEALPPGFSESSSDFPKVKCFLHCILRELQLYKEDGTVNVEGAVSAIDEPVRKDARPVVANCVAKTKLAGDKCQYTYQVVKCLKDSNNTLFYLLGLLEPPKQV